MTELALIAHLLIVWATGCREVTGTDLRHGQVEYVLCPGDRAVAEWHQDRASCDDALAAILGRLGPHGIARCVPRVRRSRAKLPR